ncbi:MAG: NERD domain-containing protein [Bacilli bacterium]|nr:NERD domain-containing protein [Bacilli bacterium]
MEFLYVFIIFAFFVVVFLFVINAKKSEGTKYDDFRNKVDENEVSNGKIDKNKVSNGKIGENEVSLRLQELGYVFDDYYTIDWHHHTHQIDHILINKKGVFVIETKALSGTIYGFELDKEWTQVLAGGKVIHKHFNPVMQNETHVREISDILEDEYDVKSMVIFINADISKVSSNFVWGMFPALNHLRSLPDIYDDETVEEIVEILEENRKYVDPEEHIKNVRNIMTGK